MWEYLKQLPIPLSFTLIILISAAVIIAVVLIALKGRLLFRWGKNLIGLGGAGAKNSDSDSHDTTSPPATQFMAKRSCGDCILILMGEREKYELKMNLKQDRLLRQQMNFIEQRLIEMEGLFIETFDKMVVEANKAGRGTREQLDIETSISF